MMLTMKEIAEKALQMRAEDDANPVPISLDEEAEYNRKLAEFLSRKDPALMCCAAPGLPPCDPPMLVYVGRKIEGTDSPKHPLRNLDLIVQRYLCLKCGGTAVAAITRSRVSRTISVDVTGKDVAPHIRHG